MPKEKQKTAIALHNFITKYLIKSQLWVSICFTGLGAFYQLAFLEKIDFIVLSLLFLCCWVGYNFIEYRSGWNRKLKNNSPSFFIFFIGFLIISVLFFFIPTLQQKSLFLFLSLLSLLYNRNFNKKTFRNLPYFKIFYISIVWAFYLVDFNLNSSNLYLFFSCTLFVLAITLAFDIRDLNTDRVKTLPSILGIKHSIALSILLLCISCLLFNFSGTSELYQLVFYISAMITASLLIFLPKKNRDFYVSFWVEGTSLLPIIIYFIIR